MLQVGDALGCDELTAERCHCAASALAAGVTLAALLPIAGCGGTVST
jgi:hypothetical protein